MARPATRLEPVRSIPSYAVIIRAIHQRDASQGEAITELHRRGLWLTEDQRQSTGLTPEQYAGHYHA